MYPVKIGGGGLSLTKVQWVKPFLRGGGERGARAPLGLPHGLRMIRTFCAHFLHVILQTPVADDEHLLVNSYL